MKQYNIMLDLIRLECLHICVIFGKLPIHDDMLYNWPDSLQSGDVNH